MKEIARLAINGWPSPKLDTLENWLYQSITSFKQKVKFLITPGGFSLGQFPKNWTGGHGWQSTHESLIELIPFATPVVDQVISGRVLRAAKGVVKYITLNVDLRAASTSLHAELIALIDVSNAKVLGWTGKSYPTMNQENKLVHVTDPATHLFRLGSDRVILLGCHDLNVFNGRARANQKEGGFRHQRCQQMLHCFNQFKPTHVIQHPHGTDTWKSWNQSWKQVSKLYPGVRWASAITYAANKGRRRAPLIDVLHRTHYEGSDALHAVVKGNRRRSMLQRHYVPVTASRKRNSKQ